MNFFGSKFAGTSKWAEITKSLIDLVDIPLPGIKKISNISIENDYNEIEIITSSLWDQR